MTNANSNASGSIESTADGPTEDIQDSCQTCLHEFKTSVSSAPLNQSLACFYPLQLALRQRLQLCCRRSHVKAGCHMLQQPWPAGTCLWICHWSTQSPEELCRQYPHRPMPQCNHQCLLQPHRIHWPQHAIFCWRQLSWPHMLSANYENLRADWHSLEYTNNLLMHMWMKIQHRQLLFIDSVTCQLIQDQNDLRSKGLVVA